MSKYLVVYGYTKNNDMSINNMVCKNMHNPPTEEEYDQIMERIIKEKNADGVVALNWLPLSDTGESEQC